MTATHTDLLQIILATAAVVFCAYGCGRAHQWYRQDAERDIAFREGYRQASNALFPLAVREMPAEAPPPER